MIILPVPPEPEGFSHVLESAFEEQVAEDSAARRTTEGITVSATVRLATDAPW